MSADADASRMKRKAYEKQLEKLQVELCTIPYKRVRRDKVALPKRSNKGGYNDQAGLREMKFVEERF